jgi:hypothetical protein
VSLGAIEGTTLKALTIIRRAYSYRDNENMKLTIIQACLPTGRPVRPWEPFVPMKSAPPIRHEPEIVRGISALNFVCLKTFLPLCGSIAG